MRKTLGLGLAIAVVLGWAAVVQANPLDVNQLAADAKWAAHLDMDAFNASSLPQKARQQLLEKHPEAERHLAMICDVWNFDPRTDLHGITIYGTQVKKNSGVAIVHAKVNQSMLTEKVKQAPNYQMSAYGKYELHSWLHAQGSKHERGLTGTFYKPDIMVFGASADEVKAALDVLDGAKPNFSSKQSGLSLSIPVGSILVAGATGLAAADLPCKSPLVKQADALVLAIGESQGEVFIAAQLVTKSAEIAQQVKTVLDGGLAMATLAKSDDANALKLIGAVKVTAADKAVTVEGRAPVDAVWAQAQKAIAKAKEAHKGWGHNEKPAACPLEKK
jgi:hypothetical protein